MAYRRRIGAKGLEHGYRAAKGPLNAERDDETVHTFILAEVGLAR